jgi:hypothetical protein
VLREAGNALKVAGEPYGIVDLDWLAWIEPPPESRAQIGDVLLRNLGLVWNTFRDAGIESLVLTRSLRDQQEVDAIRSALPGVDVSVVRLHAPFEILEDRLRERDTGTELDEHLDDAAHPPDLEGEVVDITDERPAREIARDVLAAAGWLR